MSAATAPGTREPILLLDWIRRAVEDEVDLSNLFDANSSSIFGVDPSQLPENIRNLMVLCSDDYLLSTLSVARSLAEQICEAEGIAAEEEEEENGYNYNVKLPSLPPTGTSWSDRVHVYLSSENKGDVRKLHFSIENAEITPTADEGRLEDSIQRMYFLGVLFYEIFSGGEHPCKLEQPNNVGDETSDSTPHFLSEELCQEQKLSENGVAEGGERPNGSQTVTEELSDGFNLNPFDQGGTIDLGGEHSIYDNLLSDYNLSDDDSRSYDIAFQGQGPRKKRTQNENHNMCTVSVEPLKAKGLPRALCDLVANMLNCALGTLSKDETYNKISEVRDDLQLMLDKPSIYLYDQDMGRLSTTGLHFGDTVFGRNAELSTIKEAYRRSVSGDIELVTIYGQSGTGKSFLAYEFGKYVISGGGIFLSGKFDQLQQGTPFSALASAFNQYCGILLQDCELAPIKQKLAHEVNRVLGREAYHLTKLIPNLAIILGLETNSINHDEGCINAQKRVQYLLCRFVEVISISFATPVTLFLDDLQWADPASIAAVNQLLLTDGLGSQNTPFFFLGCYRDGETNKCNPLWKALCSSDLLNARSTNINLGCMNEETLNAMVSETLCLSPRLTRSLSSIIHHKTKGNPLFISRLIILLSKEGLLRPSLSRRRWEWDKDKIQCRKLPDDVAEFLTHSIGKLSEDVKSILCIMSCFGASADITFINTLEMALQKNLLNGLDVAVKEGLLDKTDDQYRFSHDRIQEAAYSMIPFLDLCHFHFKFGMALEPFAAREGEDSILLAATSQLNLAGPEAVQDKSQNVIVANLNLRAGKKAMEMSDFVAAYSYFDNGISFLRKKHWEEHYTLSLELFDLAAQCALTNGDIVSLKILSQQVLRKSQSFGDKLNVMYLSTCSLAYSSQLPDSIKKGLDILSKLGIELKGHESSFEACIQETKYLLIGYTDDEILNTRRMSDPTMLIAMKFLGKLVTGMTQIMPKLLPYVTQRIIQLSLDHGMSPVSPIGFVQLGSCIAKLGDIIGGYRYVKLARALLDKVGSRESAGEVICFGTQVRGYVEPLQAALEYHNEGYAAAMASGDLILAAGNSMMSCSGSLFAGVNLQTILEKCTEVIKFLGERELVIFKVQTQGVQHSVVKLIGIDKKPKYVSAEEQNILATNTSVMTSYYYQKAYTSFMFRSYDGLQENVEKYLACIGNTWANLLLQHAFHTFYIGLISFWLARKSTDRQQWYERGNTSKLALQKWAESSRWNFENKWYLLEAEESYSNNDFDTAKTYYEKAISAAKDHKFVHEEALACELAAYCYLELGDTEKAMHYFLLAHEKYHEWGAFGKCDNLFKFVQSILTPASTGAGVGRTTNNDGNINDEWNRFLLGKIQDPPD